MELKKKTKKTLNFRVYIKADLSLDAPSSVFSNRFKTSAISMASSSGSWDEYDWIHCTCGESGINHRWVILIAPCLHIKDHTQLVLCSFSPGWWALVDIKRVRRLGVRAHIHRSLSLLFTESKLISSQLYMKLIFVWYCYKIQFQKSWDGT